MRRYPVVSSAIAAVGYDPESCTLEVEFTTGAVYDYDDVPPEEVLDLVRADSVGAYFVHHIRDAHPARRAA